VRLLCALLFLLAAPVQAVFDADGVPIGASEDDVKKQYPSAYCRPLEWASRAADRRCDDGRGRLFGVGVRITFYLKKDAVEAFDVRFDRRDAERLAAALVERYGKPSVEERDTRLLKLEWDQKPLRAVLSSAEKRRGSLLVARRGFEDEIYKVR
jgi:hypothetical protein